MKKIIPALLLVTILFSQAGYYGITIIRQHNAKEAMEQQILAGIPETSLVVFDAEANAPNIIWEEKGKEFLLNGKLFDIAKTKIINSRTYFYCLSDNKEEQMLKDRSNAEQSGADQNTTNKPGIHSSSFQMSDWTFTAAEKPTLLLPAAAKKYFNFSVSIISPYKKISTPPPKFYI